MGERGDCAEDLMPRSIAEAAAVQRLEWPRRAEQFRRVDEWIRKMIAWSIESHLKRIKEKTDAAS